MNKRKEWNKKKKKEKKEKAKHEVDNPHTS